MIGIHLIKNVIKRITNLLGRFWLDLYDGNCYIGLSVTLYGEAWFVRIWLDLIWKDWLGGSALLCLDHIIFVNSPSEATDCLFSDEANDSPKWLASIDCCSVQTPHHCYLSSSEGRCNLGIPKYVSILPATSLPFFWSIYMFHHDSVNESEIDNWGFDYACILYVANALEVETN